MTNPEPFCRFCGRAGVDLTRTSELGADRVEWECSKRDWVCLGAESSLRAALDSLGAALSPEPRPGSWAEWRRYRP